MILGTEGDGLASDTIADCDYTVMIPMSHGVDSLNISCASAVAFWELGKRDADRGSRKNRKDNLSEKKYHLSLNLVGIKAERRRRANDGRKT